MVDPRLEPLFTRLLRRDASGRTWLPALVAATPHGTRRLGDLVERPGSLITPLAVITQSGRLGCFTYPLAPPRELLAWFIDHPDELLWPADARLSPETVRLRQALLSDEPAGSQRRAQERAHELLRTRTMLGSEWWRFESVETIDCALITDRVVVTIEAKGARSLGPGNPWYPHRSWLVRSLEAARGLAAGGKAWASLLLGDEADPQADPDLLERQLPAAAPHRAALERAELAAAYLGRLTWREAAQAVGVSLPAPAELSGVRGR